MGISSAMIHFLLTKNPQSQLGYGNRTSSIYRRKKKERKEKKKNLRKKQPEQNKFLILEKIK